MSHAIQLDTFAINNFQQQYLKVIKPSKRLKPTIESTAKAASLFIYNIQYVGKSETPFNIRLNNLRKMSQIAMQYQLANISTGTIMTLIITEKSLS